MADDNEKKGPGIIGGGAALVVGAAGTGVAARVAHGHNVKKTETLKQYAESFKDGDGKTGRIQALEKEFADKAAKPADSEKEALKAWKKNQAEFVENGLKKETQERAEKIATGGDAAKTEELKKIRDAAIKKHEVDNAHLRSDDARKAKREEIAKKYTADYEKIHAERGGKDAPITPEIQDKYNAIDKKVNQEVDKALEDTWKNSERKAVSEAIRKSEEQVAKDFVRAERTVAERTVKAVEGVGKGNIITKQVAAFKGLGMGGKAAAIGVGAVLLGGTWLAASKMRSGGSHADRIMDERASQVEQQPAR